MDTKKILSFIALLGGEAIIIAAFILFHGSLATDILMLNIVVSSVIYGLFFLDILVPWINLNDKPGKKVGSLGVRWIFTWLFAIAAIAVMLVGNLAFEWSFALQIIIHCVLIFFLVLGLVASLHSGGKVQEVYQQETFNRSSINEMKTVMRNLKDKMSDLSELPEYFINKIDMLEDSLRFISPTENAEAHALEQQFIHVINDIAFAISNFSMNEEVIGSNLKKAERIYQSRKNIYSN
jgi:small-conductance mechanosensitive channel